MPLFSSSMGAAAVATIYVIYGAYRDYIHTQLQQRATLRDRVTYMLWVMADQADEPAAPWTVSWGPADD